MAEPAQTPTQPPPQPLRLAAGDTPLTARAVEEDLEEEKRYLWVKKIISETMQKNWTGGRNRPEEKPGSMGKQAIDAFNDKPCEFRDGPWEMNILGLRGWIDGHGKVDLEWNKYRDTFYVAYVDGDGKKRCEAFLGTTEPGEHLAVGNGKNGSKVGDLGWWDASGKFVWLAANAPVPRGYQRAGSPISHLLPNQYRYIRLHHRLNLPGDRIGLIPWPMWLFQYVTIGLKDAAGDGYKHLHEMTEDEIKAKAQWTNPPLDNHDSAVHQPVTIDDSSDGCQVIWGTFEAAPGANRPAGPVNRYFWLLNQKKDPRKPYFIDILYTLVDAGLRDLPAGGADGYTGILEPCPEGCKLSTDIGEHSVAFHQAAKRRPQLKHLADPDWQMAW